MFACPVSTRRLLWPAVVAVAAGLLLVVALRFAGLGLPTSAARTRKASVDQAQQFFDSGVIPRLRIEISAADLETLRKSPRTNVRATVREALPGKPDRVLPDVSVHLKGRIGSFRPIDDKPAMTLSFDRFVQNRRFYGLDKINLNNSVQDPSYLCEDLGSWAFRDAGVPTPRVTHARVWLNGRDLGLFVLKESFDEAFLDSFFQDHSGAIYEGNLVDIDLAVPATSGKTPKDQTGLKELLDAARESDPALRRQRVAKVLDVDRFFTFMAMEALLAHWDGYSCNRNNYRIYHDPRTTKFVFLPHGMDQLFQRSQHPLISEASLLGRTMIENSQDRARHLRCIDELRTRVLENGRLAQRFDQTSARILPALAEIGPDAVRDHQARADDLRRRIVDRTRSMDRLLASVARPLDFDATSIAPLSGWKPFSDTGDATLDRAEEDGKPLLRIRSPQGRSTASWRTTVLLPRGRYLFQGRCRAVGVASADGPNTGVGLRISSAARKGRLAGDSGWQTTDFEFEVEEPSSTVMLMCELRAGSGEACFDLNSLVVRRR